MRSDAVNGLKVLGVHQQACKLVLIALQPEKHAQPHIVYAALHGAVHSLGVVVIIMLRPRWVKLKIACFVVCLLEENVGADPGLLKLSVIFNCRRRDIHIHSADIAILMVNGIDRLNAFENVFYRIMHGIFSRLYCKAFMSHVLKSNDLIPNFPLSKLLPRNAPVLEVVRTVDTAVDAVVGKIKRREHDYSVAVEGQLYLPCERVHLLDLLRNIAGQEHRGLAVGKPRAGHAAPAFSGTRLFQQRIYKLKVMLVCLRVGDGLADLRVAYEFLGAK